MIFSDWFLSNDVGYWTIGLYLTNFSLCLSLLPPLSLSLTLFLILTFYSICYSFDCNYPLSQILSSCFLDSFFRPPSGVIPTSSSSSKTGALNRSLNIWDFISCKLINEKEIFHRQHFIIMYMYLQFWSKQSINWD